MNEERAPGHLSLVASVSNYSLIVKTRERNIQERVAHKTSTQAQIKTLVTVASSSNGCAGQLAVAIK